MAKLDFRHIAVPGLAFLVIATSAVELYAAGNPALEQFNDNRDYRMSEAGIEVVKIKPGHGYKKDTESNRVNVGNDYSLSMKYDGTDVIATELFRAAQSNSELNLAVGAAKTAVFTRAGVSSYTNCVTLDRDGGILRRKIGGKNLELTGCATATPAICDAYRVAVGSLTPDAAKEAVETCARIGKAQVELRSKMREPEYLNAVRENMKRVESEFHDLVRSEGSAVKRFFDRATDSISSVNETRQPTGGILTMSDKAKTDDSEIFYYLGVACASLNRAATVRPVAPPAPAAAASAVTK